MRMKNSGLLTKREQRERGRRSQPEYNKTCHTMEKTVNYICIFYHDNHVVFYSTRILWKEVKV